MITIYSTKTCSFCKMVEKLLQHKKVPYEVVLIDDDIELRQALFLKTGMLSVPITTDKETYVVGWQVQKLNELIASQPI